jgi:hypothetical protein
LPLPYLLGYKKQRSSGFGYYSTIKFLGCD